VRECAIKKTALFLALAFLPVFSHSQAVKLEQSYLEASKADFSAPLPEGFEKADPAKLSKELSGEALFKYLHDNSKITSSQSYDSAKKYMFSTADNAACPNGQKGVVAFYSGICVNGTSPDGSYYKEKGDQNDDGYIDSDGMNVEHLWPQSFFDEDLPMKADLHHLRTTFMKPNNMRGTAPFTEVYEGIKYTTGAGAKLGAGGFEPPDSVKGDTARAMFYFLMRYYDRQIRQGGLNYKYFFTSQVETLMKWNYSDPPDAAETRRNAAIERLQGNRNPFIDDYTLVDRIGSQVFKSY